MEGLRPRGQSVALLMLPWEAMWSWVAPASMLGGLVRGIVIMLVVVTVLSVRERLRR